MAREYSRVGERRGAGRGGGLVGMDFACAGAEWGKRHGSGQVLRGARELPAPVDEKSGFAGRRGSREALCASSESGGEEAQLKPRNQKMEPGRVAGGLAEGAEHPEGFLTEKVKG